MPTGEMSLPERAISKDGAIVVEYVDSSHRYFLRKPYARPLPSVTTILGAYDKPALVGAAAKVTLQGVSTLHDETMDTGCLIFNDPSALANELYKRELRHFQVWSGAAKRGTFAHAVAQSWIEDGRVPGRSEVPEGYAPYVEAFGNFIVAHAPVSLASEDIIASIVHGYAGRFDWLARLTKVCGIESCGCHEVIGLHGRIDFKTSKAIYPEYMAQLDLYEVGALEMGLPASDYRAPLRLGADGTYEFSVSRLPLGGALPLIEGYRARKRVADLHEHLNPKKGKPRGA